MGASAGRGDDEVRRVGAVIGLRPEAVGEYERLHRAVWPAVLAQIRRSNLRRYSIFRHDLLLFAYYEHVGEDLAADLAAMAEDPVTQRWWRLTAPLQVPVDDAPHGTWTVLPEVFHAD